MADTNATITAMAKQLKEGETVSRSKRIPLDELDTKKVSRKLSSMRNSMNQIAARAREATERGYRVESGQFVTYDGTAVMLVVALTCMEDEGEDDIDIGGERLGELLGAHTVRVVLRAVERHQVDHVHETNLQLRQPGLEDLRCGDRLDGDHIAGRQTLDPGHART